MAIVATPTTHFHFKVPEGSTSVRRNIYFALDTGEPDAGLVEGDFLVAAESEFAYFRDDASASVDAAADGTNTLADSTTLGTWEDGGFKVIDATKLPGWYEVGFPDDAFVHTANGVGQANVTFNIKADDASNTQSVQVTFELVKGDGPRDIQQFKLAENSTSVLKHVYFQNDDGTAATGLVAADFTVADAGEFAYFRADAAAAVDAANAGGTNALHTATTLGTWETSEFKEISSSLMPGWYEVGFPDAAFIESSEGSHTVTFTLKPDLSSLTQPTQVQFEMVGGASGGSGGSGATAVQRFIRKANDVNVRENIYLVSDATGEAVTGLAKADFTIANNAEFAYYRGDAAAAVDAAFDATTCLGDTTTLGTWLTATIKEISSTLMPGWYEVSFPNAAFIIGQTSGVKPRAVTFLIKPEDDASVSPVNVIFDLFRSVAR